MKLTYTKQGDYLIPYITIRQPRKALGHYGRLRKAYLQNFRPILFNELVLSDMLFEHCLEIEETARNQIDVIMSGLMKQYGITEELKAENQMEWVRQMNAFKAQAEEVVKAELIYDWARKSGQKNVRTFLISHKSCGRIVHKFYGIICTSK